MQDPLHINESYSNKFHQLIYLEGILTSIPQGETYGNDTVSPPDSTMHYANAIVSLLYTSPQAGPYPTSFLLGIFWYRGNRFSLEEVNYPGSILALPLYHKEVEPSTRNRYKLSRLSRV